MTQKTSTLHRLIIIAFCCWHMLAIGTYNVPWRNVSFHPAFNRAVNAYILTTSQWQKWNLFSPEPQSNVITYVFEQNVDGNWQEFKRIGADNVAWHQQSYLLKMIRRIEKEPVYEPMRNRLLVYMCRKDARIAAKTPVRLRKIHYKLPRNFGSDYNYITPQWWQNWKPPVRSTTLFETFCPA